jgi:NADH-quinone oxidoreductase subunit J
MFAAASALATASTVLVVTRRNPVYSAAWMLASLMSVAVVYLLLHASFLFVIQVLLYAGAIMVLFVFVIMLLNPAPEDLALDRPSTLQKVGGGIFALALFALLTKAIFHGGAVEKVLAFTAKEAAQPAAAFGTVPDAGRKLYDDYLVAFEMISVLITAAIAAVVLLAKRRLEPGGGSAFEDETGNVIGGRRRGIIAAAEELAKKLEKGGDGGNGNGSGHGSGHGHGHAAPPRGGKVGGAH